MSGSVQRAQVQAALEASPGLTGWTAKLEIGAGDCYLTVAVREARIVYVTITVSRVGGSPSIMGTHQVAVLEASKLDVTKALVEVACREANELLQRQAWGAADLVAAWRGTRFDPEGVCPQVQGIVTSPLDAAAKWIEMKMQQGGVR
jgi:hypothetical protein